MGFFWIFAVLFQFFSFTSASGTVEIQILKYTNPRQILNDGRHCPSGSISPLSAPGACRVRLHVCVKEFLNRLPSFNQIDPNSCTYGSSRTRVLDPDLCKSEVSERRPQEGTEFCAKTHVDFNFSWPGTMTLVLELRHHDVISGKSYVIQRWAQPMRLKPSDGFKKITIRRPSSIFSQLAVGVNCSGGYFGPNCSMFCQPRNDDNGHFTCNHLGSKLCLPGWKGQYCDQPICPQGCGQGKCVAPDKCRCDYGWRGEHCNQCIPYENCQHGSCQKPNECLCEERWGGPLCDQDMDYCLHNNPCRNGATCNPHAPNNFTCICPPGFAGRRCEIVVHPCFNNPCKHFGTCVVVGHRGFQCVCPPWLTGPLCELSATESVGSQVENATETGGYGTSGGVVEPCFYQGEYYPHWTKWDTMDCRQCTCSDGTVNCTEARCMAENCLESSRGCPKNQVCKPVQSGSCLKEPCEWPYGQCKPWQLVDKRQVSSGCREKLDVDGSGNEECARFYMRMDADRMPQGTSVESVCFHIILWMLTKEMNHFTAECRLIIEGPFVLEVDLIGIDKDWPLSSLKENLMTELREKSVVSSQLRAVQFVTDQPIVLSTWSPNGPGTTLERKRERWDEGTTEKLLYMGLACAVLLLIIVALLAAVFHLWRKRLHFARLESMEDFSRRSSATTLTQSTTDGTLLNSPKSQGRNETEFRWNNLGPYGVVSCGSSTWSPWGRPGKMCNLWRCGEVDSGLATKQPAYEMEESTVVVEGDSTEKNLRICSGGESGKVAAVRPIRLITDQPAGAAEDRIVSVEAVV